MGGDTAAPPSHLAVAQGWPVHSLAGPPARRPLASTAIHRAARPPAPPPACPQWFLDRRRWVLSNTGSEWAGSVQRVDIYSWVLQLGGEQLGRPIKLTWAKCRPESRRGPCEPQPGGGKAELAIGGVIYGDFLLP